MRSESRTVSGSESDIQKRLFAMQDLGYRDFQSALMPTVDKARIIGVRTPLLRTYAKSLRGTDAAKAYMEQLPHAYYEEDHLHGFLIEGLGDFEETVAALDRFLPYVDNWATCDSTSPKVFAEHREALLSHALRWTAAEPVYVCRYGIGMLMRYFLTDRFSPEYLQLVAGLNREEYYIKMMVAWYFATALAFRYEEVFPYLTEGRLSPWIRRKTIQKAIESRRLTEEQKHFLRSLRETVS